MQTRASRRNTSSQRANASSQPNPSERENANVSSQPYSGPQSQNAEHVQPHVPVKPKVILYLLICWIFFHILLTISFTIRILLANSSLQGLRQLMLVQHCHHQQKLDQELQQILDHLQQLHLVQSTYPTHLTKTSRGQLSFHHLHLLRKQRRQMIQDHQPNRC